MGKDTAILYMIRHGMTFGNSLSRYIGTTDEPVLDTEPARLTALAEKYRETGQLPEQAASLWVSPLLRCRQTAGIFYPDAAQRTVAELRECDFGRFENKNYKEMDGDPEYQAWIDSNGTLPFPGGESVEGFTARTVRGLRQAVEEAQAAGLREILLFVHGGSIMSILSACHASERAYYEWHVQNAEGYRAEVDLEAFRRGEDCFLLRPEKIG